MRIHIRMSHSEQQRAMHFESLVSDYLFSVVLAAYKWFKISAPGVQRRHMWQLDKNLTLLCWPALDEQFEPLRRDVAFLMLAAIINDVPASRFLILDLRPELKFIEVVVLDIAFMIILSTLPLMIVVVVLLRFKVILLLLCLLLCCGGISNELGKCKCGV